MDTVQDLKSIALNAARRLGRFSVVLPQALSLCTREDECTANEFARVAERDVVITGNLMSMANSALYGRATPVSTVRAAIVRLGTRKARNVLLALSVARSINRISIPGGKWSAQRFNNHSLAAALLSDLIAQNVQVPDSEWAFVAGLLHDVGLLLIAVAFPERLDAFGECGADDHDLARREREMLGFTHFEIGAEFLEKWNFPPLVREAIEACPEAPLDGVAPLHLASTISAASLLADLNGHSVFAQAKPNHDDAELLDLLKIPNPAHLREAFEREWQSFEACVAA